MQIKIFTLAVALVTLGKLEFFLYREEINLLLIILLVLKDTLLAHQVKPIQQVVPPALIQPFQLVQHQLTDHQMLLMCKMEDEMQLVQLMT